VEPLAKHSPDRKRENMVGLEVELQDQENARGWIQEVSQNGDGFLVGLYPDGDEVKSNLDSLSDRSLYGPPLPVMDGFAAIDFISEDGSIFSSIRIPSSTYQKFVSAAESLNQDLESFLRDCLIAGAEAALEESDADSSRENI